MTNLTRYTAADLPALIDRINKYSIGMDETFDRLFRTHQAESNYPPYNLVQVSSSESRLELALAGFKKEEVHVYTKDGKLFVEGQKGEDDSGANYIHRGVASTSFTRAWTLSDETEVRSVTFDDGLLTVTLGKIVPDHHQRRDWF